MNRIVRASGAAALILVVIQPGRAWARGGESDAAIRQKIIQASIAEYPGNCPCPYNTDRAGRSCGRRSAYSRPGGYAPKCFPADVSEAEVRAYRVSH
jgi:hypothetical protein